MNPLDQAYDTLRKLLEAFRAQGLESESEAELRFQFIDAVLLDVLGWRREDIRVEPLSDAGYADYLLKLGSRNAAVIEAKRASTELLATVKTSLSSYLLRGPALKPALPGITQAKGYASDRGCGLAAVTSGVSWIAFNPNRRDGLDFLDGHAIAFPTLESLQDAFAEFYDIFSKEGASERRYSIHLSRAEGTMVTPHIQWFKAIEDRYNTLLPLSALGSDLDKIFDRFFRSLMDETDSQMLVDCFVESKESRDADSTLRKLTEEVLADIALLSTGTGEELKREIEETIQAQVSEIVLIVGNKGSGKTTFIDRFYSIVLPKTLRDQCVVARANLADATQDESTIEAWLNEKLITDIEARLFAGGIPTFEDLQGIYFYEYQSWQTGEFKYLCERDKIEFKIKFGEFIQNARQSDRLSYLKKLLTVTNRQRSLLPCLIFDNTDQFPQLFQERVFQYAYALHNAAVAFVVVPITDRTIWQLSKAGPFQSYATKSFFLPVPSTKEVLEKRVAYIRRRTMEEKSGGTYFLSRGIRAKLENIVGFAAAIEELFIRRDFVARRVSWLSNGDLRRGLELTRRIVTSPVMQIDQLVSTYVSGYSFNITDNLIVRALIQNRHRYFDEDSSDFVQNLFAVPFDHVVSPLLKLSILQVLLDALGPARDELREQFVEIAQLLGYFESCGAREGDVLTAVEGLIGKRLAEPYDPADDSIQPEQRIRIALPGRMHLEMATGEPQYINQMAMRTAVRSQAATEKIRPTAQWFPKEAKPWRELAAVFAEYLLSEDSTLMAIPRDMAYESQRILRAQFRMRWIAKPDVSLLELN